MINWKELEKFIAPGKVVTLVIMVDGKEISALSFNVDTLAYKEILESVSKVDTTAERIHIPDKITEAKTSDAQKKFDKQADKALSKSKTKVAEPVKPAVEETDDENESPFIDEDTGEVIEGTESISDKIDMNANSIVDPGISEKRLSRAEIMAQSEVPDSKEPTNTQREEWESSKQPENLVGKESAEARANDHSGSKSAEVDGGPDSANKVDDTLFGEEW